MPAGARFVFHPRKDLIVSYVCFQATNNGFKTKVSRSYNCCFASFWVSKHPFAAFSPHAVAHDPCNGMSASPLVPKLCFSFLQMPFHQFPSVSNFLAEVTKTVSQVLRLAFGPFSRKCSRRMVLVTCPRAFRLRTSLSVTVP